MTDDYDAEAGIEQAAAARGDACSRRSGADAGRLLGVGMGLPGPVHRSGVVGSSAILPGWAGHARGRAHGRAARPWRSWLGNDANLGALAEATWGAGRDACGLVYLKLATGIGAGIVIDGRLFDGAGGTAGEIGHTSLDETGDICRCGSRGCLETYASGAAIAALLSRSLGEPLSLDDVLARAVDGDPGCRRALADAGRHIGAVGRRPLQPHQPRADRRWGQHGRRRRRAARPAQRSGWTTGHPERGRGREDRPRRARGARRVARRGRARAPRGRSRMERSGAGGQDSQRQQRRRRSTDEQVQVHRRRRGPRGRIRARARGVRWRRRQRRQQHQRW